jgi:putative membrane protein
MMWYWGNGGHWWWMLTGVMVMVVFWGAIFWAIWYFVTNDAKQPEQGARPDDAKRILDERLARGEIGADEYERLRDLVRSDGARATNGHHTVSAGDPR